MSAFSGPSWEHSAAHWSGTPMQRHRKQKRAEAEERNARTPVERTRQYRREQGGE